MSGGTQSRTRPVDNCVTLRLSYHALSTAEFRSRGVQHQFNVDF